MLANSLKALVCVFLLSACGATTKSGQCKDYKPINMCDDDSVYECQTTDDGCEQCGCVPIKR